MPCCGQTQMKGSANGKAHPGTVRVTRAIYGTVTFEYTGKTSLTVTGPLTRTTYRFEGPGARATVDARDSAALATIRALRQG